MSSEFLVIPNIEVSDCNLESSHLSASFPMTAAAGFTERVLRELEDITVRQCGASLFYKQWCASWPFSFAVLLHDYQLFQGTTKNPLALCSGNGGKQSEDDLLNPPIIPEIKGRIRFSLLIELSECFSEKFYSNQVQAELYDRLMTLRFAGGDFISVNKELVRQRRRFVADQDEATPLSFLPLISEAELPLELARLPQGWFIKSRADLLRGVEDKMARILEAMGIERTQDGRRRKLMSGWLFATGVGFELLERPTVRDGVRQSDFQHAFCEPVLSLAELVGSRKARAAFEVGEEANRKDFFWQWFCDPKERFSVLEAASCELF